MFVDFYGLKQQPVGVTLDPCFLHPSPANNNPWASLFYGIDGGRGTSREFMRLLLREVDCESNELPGLAAQDRRLVDFGRHD
jgi:hypothetical protein